MLFSHKALVHDNNKIFVQNYTCAGGTTSTPLWQKIRLLVEHGLLASWQKNVMQYVLPMYFLRFSRVGIFEKKLSRTWHILQHSLGWQSLPSRGRQGPNCRPIWSASQCAEKRNLRKLRFLTSFKWLGFALLTSASFLTCGILMKGISEMSVSRRYPKMHLRIAWCATMRRGAVDPDRHSSSNRSRKGTKRSQQST